MEKLKAALCGKDIRLDGSPLINSQQGSCSKGGSAALGKDLGLNEGPRKKLKLTGDCVDEVEEEDHAVGKTTQLGEEMVKENNQEVGKSVTVVDEQLEWNQTLQGKCQEDSQEENSLGKYGGRSCANWDEGLWSVCDEIYERDL
ncbi:hypothetical protein ACET3Z_005022 [Daucus carota]